TYLQLTCRLYSFRKSKKRIIVISKNVPDILPLSGLSRLDCIFPPLQSLSPLSRSSHTRILPPNSPGQTFGGRSKAELQQPCFKTLHPFRVRFKPLIGSSN